MRYTKAMIVDRFLIHAVDVTLNNGRRIIGRIILNNDPGAYQTMATKFLLLPLSDNDGECCAFNPSHVRKIEFYHSNDHIKLED